MKVKKFEGATMRDAIAKVKAELGDQAVILATREVRRGLLAAGVEISAAIDDEDHREGPMRESSSTATPPARAEELEQLRGELRSLRAIVRNGSGSNNDKHAAELRGEVATLRRLVEELRGASKPTPKAAPRGPQLVAPSHARVVMLVGPTGVGKTTTIAKLAARAALVDGKRVALVTLDNYRIGGVEQIRTFAELIGVPLHVAESPAALPNLSSALDEDLVLVDTSGRSPRDTRAIGELAAGAHGLDIETHLVVSAAASPAQVDSLLARYRALEPARLLFTKLDEVERAPELQAAPLRLALPITWVTTGQAVPEDLEEPNEVRVLDLATNGMSALATSNAA